MPFTSCYFWLLDGAASSSLLLLSLIGRGRHAACSLSTYCSTELVNSNQETFVISSILIIPFSPHSVVFSLPSTLHLFPAIPLCSTIYCMSLSLSLSRSLSLSLSLLLSSSSLSLSRSPSLPLPFL